MGNQLYVLGVYLGASEAFASITDGFVDWTKDIGWKSITACEDCHPMGENVGSCVTRLILCREDLAFVMG